MKFIFQLDLCRWSSGIPFWFEPFRHKYLVVVQCDLRARYALMREQAVGVIILAHA